MGRERKTQEARLKTQDQRRKTKNARKVTEICRNARFSVKIGKNLTLFEINILLI